ncbi:hypothetical protein [Bacillus sp. m3-13]|uniref:hypothetical protein n=1 Tax=Bacillus sp. m3-13 TaxID=406124 RepID=UPI0001E89FC7|nr:hypothetical protein [Bacillus sp. m3-13]
MSLDQADYPQLEKLWNFTDLLILPVASFQLVSKLALMVDDDRAIHTAIQFQLLGKPIVIAHNEVELGVYQTNPCTTFCSGKTAKLPAHHPKRTK